MQDSEIVEAINFFQPLKAPGPDGLYIYFYQHYWSDIKQSITTFCHQIFSTHAISSEINTTYICLIPKNNHVASVIQYRPISLCNTIYKVITKIIVNRLMPLIPKIISPTQTSFQQNRRAADNAIIVQEIIT